MVVEVNNFGGVICDINARKNCRENEGNANKLKQNFSKQKAPAVKIL